MVHAMLWVPEFDVDTELDLLVDTGADVTVLHPWDSARLFSESQFAELRTRPVRRIGGAGQSLPYYRVPATIQFVGDDEAYYPIDFELHVGERERALGGLESLLARDVLRHFTTMSRGLDAVTMERIA